MKEIYIQIPYRGGMNKVLTVPDHMTQSEAIKKYNNNDMEEIKVDDVDASVDWSGKAKVCPHE